MNTTAASLIGDHVRRDLRSRTVAPSEAAAMMDDDPWQTRAALITNKTVGGSRPPMASTPQPGLGWDKQPELAEDFAARHPQYDVVTTGHWQNRERPYQVGQPHRLLTVQGTVVAALTFRTTPAPLDDKGWGSEESGRTPAHVYHHQQWLLDLFGLDYGYVIAYSKADDETRTYRIVRDEAHIAALRSAALRLLDDVSAAR